MAITFVNYTSSSSGSTPVSAVKPTGVTTGDKMIAFAYDPSTSATLTGATGWTQVGSTTTNATAGTFAVYYKDDNGTAGPYSFSTSGTSIEVVIVGYRGAAPGTPDQSHPQANTSTGGTAPNSGVTPSVGGETLIYGAMWGAARTSTGTSGWTQRADNFTTFWYVQDLIGASSGASGSIAVTMVSGLNTTSCTWMLALALPSTSHMTQRMVL